MQGADYAVPKRCGMGAFLLFLIHKIKSSAFLAGLSLRSVQFVVQAACAVLPDEPGAVGHLDSDTALSHGSIGAALAGVGACCRAVDQIMKGSVSPAHPPPPPSPFSPLAFKVIICIMR